MTTSLSHILTTAARIEGVRTTQIRLEAPMIDLAARVANAEGTVFLLSGGAMDSSRYHILGLDPWLTLKGNGHRLRLTLDDQEHRLTMDPLFALRAIVDRYQTSPTDRATPLAAGLMGYLAYDLKDVLEELPRTSVDRWQLPHLCFYAPAIILVYDKRQQQVYLHEIIRREGYRQRSPAGQDRIAALLKAPRPGEG
ncbi:MAG: aminodeoxychorismate synthase, component I, partial [Desulfobacterales bacterium]